MQLRSQVKQSIFFPSHSQYFSYLSTLVESDRRFLNWQNEGRIKWNRRAVIYSTLTINYRQFSKKKEERVFHFFCFCPSLLFLFDFKRISQDESFQKTRAEIERIVCNTRERILEISLHSTLCTTYKFTEISPPERKYTAIKQIYKRRHSQLEPRSETKNINYKCAGYLSLFFFSLHFLEKIPF